VNIAAIILFIGNVCTLTLAQGTSVGARHRRVPCAGVTLLCITAAWRGGKSERIRPRSVLAGTRGLAPCLGPLLTDFWRAVGGVVEGLAHFVEPKAPCETQQERLHKLAPQNKNSGSVSALGRLAAA